MFYQSMKRPSGEKPCEKVSPIASITCHPKSSFGVLPASAKQDNHWRRNNFQGLDYKRVTGLEPATFSLGS